MEMCAISPGGKLIHIYFDSRDMQQNYANE